MRAFQKNATSGARALLVVATMAIGASTARSAHAQRPCDEFKLKFTTSVPPDNNFAGSIYFNIESTCTNNSKHAPLSCGGSVQLPTLETVTDKCSRLASAIASQCPVFTVTSSDCTNAGGGLGPNFTLVDPGCSDGGTNDTIYGANNGIFLTVSNDDSILQAVTGGPDGGAQLCQAMADYELDILQPDCPKPGLGTATFLRGNQASGVPITGSVANVTAVVNLPQDGGGTSSDQIAIPTFAGQTVAQILTEMVGDGGTGLVNQNLFGTGVTCFIDPLSLRGALCHAPDGGLVDLSLQVDDLGLCSRVNLAGPPTVVQNIVAMVNQTDASLSTVVAVDSGVLVTSSSSSSGSSSSGGCPEGVACPASPPNGIAASAGLLICTGAIVANRARRRRRG